MSSSSQQCLSLVEFQIAEQDLLDKDRLEHLNSCPLCNAAYMSFLMLDEEQRAALQQHSFEVPAPAPAPLAPVELLTRPASPIHKIRRSLYLYLAAAAALLILVWFGVDAYRDRQREELLADHFFEVEEPYLRMVRSEELINDYYTEATLAYESRHFDEAIDSYARLVNEAKTSGMAARGEYELGISYWKNQEPEQAIPHLEMARDLDADYFENATWALAQLERSLGNTAKAIKYYRELSNRPQSKYQELAQTFLDALE